MKADLTGVRAGGYVIGSKLGEGGMGSVYRAENPITGRHAVVKVSDLTAPALLARFEQEAKAASKVQHRNLVQVYDVGFLADGRLYILMEFLDGNDLEKHLQSYQKLTAEDALRILSQIASGLEAMHAAGVIHRDLKPANVILVDGEARRAKIVDFGLAKLDDPGGRLTQHGFMAGSASYMAPEQAGSFATVDGRADVYGLGVIAVRAIAGCLPYPGNGALEVLKCQLENPFLARAVLEREAAHAPPAWFDIILRAIEYRAEARYQSAREFVLALASALPNGERIVRAVAPDLYEKGPPEAETVKNPSAEAPTRVLSVGPPPPAPTTHGAAAGAMHSGPIGRSSRRRVVAAIAGVSATAAVVGITALSFSSGNRDTEGRAAASELADPTPIPASPPDARPEPEQRTVRIETEPPGAEIVVDGEARGLAPATLTADVGETLAVRVDLDGHETAERTVEVHADLDALRIELVPVPPPPPPRAATREPPPRERRTSRDRPRPQATGRSERTPQPPRLDLDRPVGPQ